MYSNQFEDQVPYGRRRKQMEGQMQVYPENQMQTYPVLPMRQPLPPPLVNQTYRFYYSKGPATDRNNYNNMRWRPRYDDYSYGDYPRTPCYRPHYNRNKRAISKGLKRSLENGCHSRSNSPEGCEGKRGKGTPIVEIEPSDPLTVEIQDLCVAHTQKKSTYDEKKQLHLLLEKYVEESLCDSYIRCWLFMVGSSENGFGGESSDLDLCVQVPTHFDLDRYFDLHYIDYKQLELNHRQEAINVLKKIMTRLKKSDEFGSLDLIRAKVPILKFVHLRSGIEVDLNCNNTVGIRNTHLLKYYSELDWRVRPLVLTVKIWAQKKKINDAKNQTISSYSLVLMVIHYLQYGVNPTILPCLQSCYPMVFDSKQNVHGLRHNAPLKNTRSANPGNLSTLFLGFLEYYNKFDFSKHVISVRTGGLMPVENFRKSYWEFGPYQWKYLCIEEPFNRSNTARSVYDQTTWDRIRQVFEDSYNTLVRTRCFKLLLENGETNALSISESNSLNGSDSAISSLSSEDASS